MAELNRMAIAAKGSAAVLVAIAGAAKAQDLEGLYGGLSYTNGSGDLVYNFGPVDTYSLDGNAVGGFVGYNHMVGDWLFGAELAFSNGDYESFFPGGTAALMDVEDIRDIKARVGRVFGTTLVYGVIGRSTMDIDMFGTSATDSDGDASATAYGLGFETALGNKAFVGGEYLTRDLDLSSGPAFYVGGGAKLNTLSLRMGLRF